MTKKKKDELFEELYNSKIKAVIGLCYTRVRDLQLAESLAHEIFINVYKSMDKFRGESKLSTWLYRIAKNYCCNYNRYTKSAKRFAVTLSIDDLAETAAKGSKIDGSGLWAYKFLEDKKAKGALSELCEKEGIAKIRTVIETLSPESRQAFLTLFNDGDVLSYQEAAKIIKIPVNTMRSRLSRARSTIKSKLLESKTWRDDRAA